MTTQSQTNLIAEYQRSLNDCRQLYVESGRQCINQYPHIIDKSPEEFVEMMDDLHRGLVVKVYFVVALSDQKWSRFERQLSQVLFDHVWDRWLEGEDLREAAREMSTHVERLQWYSLIRPFVTMSPLRDEVGKLETVIMRMANVVGKANGSVDPRTARALSGIQYELEQHLQPLAIDQATASRSDGVRAKSQATVRAIPADARQVRAECDLPNPKSPARPMAPEPAADLSATLAELEGLIGLQSVKDEIRTLTNLLKLQAQRVQSGLPNTPITLHMVFAGNPGTGKTTVARIVGRILGAMGILKRGHLIETDRSGLVAEYAGQTAPKTNKIIDEALDGVLFIDEAYSLVSSEGEDAYGHEALQVLLKRMEDARDRLVVILAGYPQPMQRLIAANPGLSSRFSRTLTFPDYATTELARIFQLLCDKNYYELPAAVRARLLVGLQWLYEQRDDHFGNGRVVRNLFEEAIRGLANRIAGVVPVTRDLLTTLHEDDVPFATVPSDIMQCGNGALRVRVACPGCGDTSMVVAEHLGRRFRCRPCQAEFTADWGEPVTQSADT
ncbi:MAG: AAA family ATPase [Pirellulaceae bacterium]|nr:AAA family ATPase [Planctomycetales bacterium]